MSAMSAAKVESPQGGSPSSIITLLLRYGALMLVDALALFLFYGLAGDGVWEVAIAIALITVLVNVINLAPNLVPLRWISPSLALLLLMVVYPIIYTVYVSFTNYGDAHPFTKDRTIALILNEQIIGRSYEWAAYIKDDQYAIMLIDEDGPLQFVAGNEAAREVERVNGGLPPEVDGYTLDDSRRTRTQIIASLSGGATFGPPDDPISVNRNDAVIVNEKASRYAWDAEANTLTNTETGEVFRADDQRGWFIRADRYDDYLALMEEDPNARLDDYLMKTQQFGAGVGYRVVVGLENFGRFFSSPALRGPLVSIFLWTVTFSFMSVLMTFTMGLLIALLLQAETPGKRIFRTMLIVPYALPALIAVVTWRGMLNDNFGVITLNIVRPLESLLGIDVPSFFSDPTMARVGLLLVNLWLGYPYFMLVCSGALAGIPSDMYEAASVDGASWWQQFRSLTLPLLLVSVGPLLIASFTFNFNNYVMIEAYNEGGPPIAGAGFGAGHTDLLINYAFQIAFGTGRGADYGLASTVSIVIFMIVAAITVFQKRFTRNWEETGRNV